jgi:hypothetical protein
VSPYRTAGILTTNESGWTVRRVDIVYGAQVESYTWHRWYWTAYLRAWLWTALHGFGAVQFRKGCWTDCSDEGCT